MTAADSEKYLLIQDITEKYLWAVWVRYLIAGLGFLLFLASYFNTRVHYFILEFISFVAFYNLLAHFLFRFNRQPFKLWQIVVLRAVFQALDIFSTTFLIFLTGWLESPYWFFYLILIVLSGFGVFSIYSALSVFLIALISMIFYLGLLLLTYFGLLPIYGPAFTLDPQQLLSSIFNRAIFTTITLFLFAVTIYYFSKLLSQQRDELLQKNQELLAALGKMKKVDRLKDEFVSTASHELRTPLAVIRENTSLISDGVAGAVSEKQKALLTASQANVDRLAGILDNLLDVAKIESRSIELKRRRTDICSLALKAVDLLKNLADKKMISIETRLTAGAITWADPDQILRVFVNLIDNAVKYTGEKGRVTIGVERLGGEIRAEVSDTGIGIAEADKPMIFERFVRLSGAEDMATGTGLGLSICRAIVEMHKGRIWFESQVGQGSKFIFALPKVESGE